MRYAVVNRAAMRVADTTDISGRVTAGSINERSRAKRPNLWRICGSTTQLRRGVVGVIAAFVVVSLSFSVQAGEKKKVMLTHKSGPVISRTVAPLGPGDDPKHELVVLQIHVDSTTSSDPDWNEARHIVYEQHDSVAGTGTHRGYYTNLLKNGDTEYGQYEGTFKTTFKEDGSWETTTWEGTFKVIGGTGKFKNIKGSGTYRGKVTAEGAITEVEGEIEY